MDFYKYGFYFFIAMYFFLYYYYGCYKHFTNVISMLFDVNKPPPTKPANTTVVRKAVKPATKVKKI